MNIYLAARYSRREELCRYRDQLVAAGHEVPCRWLDGKHQISDDGTPIGEHGESLVEGDSGSDSEEAVRLRRKFAAEDVADVLYSDVLVAFTEPPRSSASRGGRHVELGMALAWDMKVIVVGHRENLFCWMPHVEFFANWDDCFQRLNGTGTDC